MWIRTWPWRCAPASWWSLPGASRWPWASTAKSARSTGARCSFSRSRGLATGLSWICYFRALQLGPASRVAPLDKLSVPLVMVFAWLLLGEKLNATAVAGGLLITAGAIVMVMS